MLYPHQDRGLFDIPRPQKLGPEHQRRARVSTDKLIRKVSPVYDGEIPTDQAWVRSTDFCGPVVEAAHRANHCRRRR